MADQIEFTNPNQQFYLDAGFIFGFVDDLTAIFVKIFQEYFRHHPLTKDFKFLSNSDPNSKIRIAEEYEINERFFPCIIISTIPITGSPWSLGDNLGVIKDNTSGKTYLRKGGMITATVQISVLALNVRECKRITDIAGLGLCYPLQRELAKNNVIMVPTSFRLSALAERVVTPTIKAFQIDIGQQVQTSWVQDFEVNAEELRGISDLKGVKIQPMIPKEGEYVHRDKGIISTATLNTITDGTKSWPENAFRTYQLLLKKPGSTLYSYTLDIVSNTSNTITFTPALTETPMYNWEYFIVSQREQIEV